VNVPTDLVEQLVHLTDEQRLVAIRRARRSGVVELSGQFDTFAGRCWLMLRATARRPMRLRMP